jgi:hypothetical protein
MTTTNAATTPRADTTPDPASQLVNDLSAAWVELTGYLDATHFPRGLQLAMTIAATYAGEYGKLQAQVDARTDAKHRRAAPHIALGAVWSDIMALVPLEQRPRFLELALLAHGEYAAGEAGAYRDGYDEGRSDAINGPEGGYQDGWTRGWEAATNDVLARTGSPAITPEHLEAEEPLPPC